MKYLLFTIMFVLSVNFFAQDKVDKPGKFIRIYDLQGKKISKGKIKSITETSVSVIFLGKLSEIPLSNIGIIKTKHSAGNNIAKGAIIGASSLAIIGLTNGDNKGEYVTVTASDKAMLGFISGSILGTIIGGITTIFKKPKTYIINGNPIKFNEFKKKITTYS